MRPSKTVTSCPARINSKAAHIPARPAPMTTMRCGVCAEAGHGRAIAEAATVAAAPARNRRRVSLTPSFHHVDDDVDGEFGVVFTEKALVTPVVIPLAAVILAAVQNREPSPPLDALQVFVHDVVAPTVQLVR